MESSWKHIIYVNLGLNNFVFLLENMYVLGTIRVRVIRFVCENVSTYFENNFTEMRIEKWLIFHY